jgi:site-specific recombinase XerC
MNSSSTSLPIEPQPLPSGADARLWLSDPVEAHKQWRAGLALASGCGRSGVETAEFRDYATHTTAIYRSLFKAFCRWMAGEHLRLDSIGAQDIRRFLAQVKGRGGRPATVRTRRMYLGEIDRVLAHLVALELRNERPSREVIDRLRNTEPLRPRHIQLPAAGFAPSMQQHLVDVGLDPNATPRAVRDAACTSLLLDCGLSVKELQKLQIRHFTPATAGQTARIHAPGHRLLRARDLELSSGTAALLERWIGLRLANVPAPRDTAEAGGAKLFVQGTKISALRSNTVHNAAVAAGRTCGVAAGPQMLRNEFVAHLLRQDVDMQTVAGLAGLNDLDQVHAMKRALAAEVVAE